jgi:hypothetical protein
MKKLFLIFLLGLLVCCTQKAQSANLYSRQTTFPPLKLSQEDLKALISNIEIYVAKANSESVTTVVHQVEISDGEKTITYKGSVASLPIERLPEICYKLTYFYYLPYSEDSSVSQIAMNFDDYSRTLTVQGSQPEQVDGLFLLIQDDISKHISRFGGSGFRQLFVMSIYFLVVGLGAFFYFLRRNGWYFLFGSICGAAILIVGFLLPLPKILPGFALISGEVSWIRRYSAEIGFYGLIITLLIASIPFLKIHKKHARKKSIQTSE